MRKPGRLALVALLIGACAVFIAATAWVYVRQIEQKTLLAETIRASGWTAYQAQLEYVKALGALDLAIDRATPERLEALALRLEILLSRLPLLTRSDEGDFLLGVEGVETLAAGLGALASRASDRLAAAAPDDPALGVELEALRAGLAPYGVDLQRLLQEAIAYNERLYKREAELAQTTAIVPLVLLVASGALLVVMLLLQARRAEMGLDQMRLARAEAAENEASLRRIVEAAPIAFVLADPHSHEATFINAAAAALVRPQAGDPAWRDVVNQLRRALRDRPGAAPGAPASVTLRHPSGSLMTCAALEARVVWGGRELILLAILETTHSRSAERQAMQASTLAAIGEMAAAIVHEINQPLATIKMASANAVALAAEGGPIDRVLPKLQRIDAQVDRARRITDQVRRLVRRGAGARAPFPLHDATELAVGALAEQLRLDGVSVALQIEEARGREAEGDQTLYEQVLVNLLLNALDAFRLRPRADEAPAPRVVVSARADAESVTIRVADNAGGIAPEVLDRLFEPFVTTKPPGQGTGLGLSLCRKIVADMGGRIAGGDADGGAAFEVTIPAPARGAGAPEPREAAA